MLYIRCSNLIGSKHRLGDAAVLLDGSRILAVDSVAALPMPTGAQLLDVRGLSAAPGFIDWQINGGFGMDFTENPESIWDVAARLPEYGVTALLPTIITAPLEVYSHAQEVLRVGAPAGFKGAQALGFHFEGPYLNPGKKGAHNPNYLRTPSTHETRSWSRKKGVWLVTLAPELPEADGLIQSLLEKGVVISAGHSLATYEQARQAFEAGVSCVTHLFNAMPPMDHRAPGLVAASLQTQKVFSGLIPDGIHVHPAMVALAWKHKGPRQMAIITDAMGALGMPPGFYRLGDFQVSVDDVSARLENGTLAGSILRMDQAVRNLMAFTGCSLAQAVGAASQNVARLVKARGKGRLQAGADADIVLLDGEANVMVTIAKGEKVFSKL